MTAAEIRFLTFDGPVEPDCPYCELPASGPMVGDLHEHCHEAMNCELVSVEIFDVEHDGDFPIREKEGLTVGYPLPQ